VCHGTIFHPVGTAHMGPDGAPGAVVDQECRVRGIEHLRMVDASIMTGIPRANANLTCIMIGERMADLMRASTQHSISQKDRSTSRPYRSWPRLMVIPTQEGSHTAM
jgi:choline dehydrogenase